MLSFGSIVFKDQQPPSIAATGSVHGHLRAVVMEERKSELEVAWDSATRRVQSARGFRPSGSLNREYS